MKERKARIREDIVTMMSNIFRGYFAVIELFYAPVIDRSGVVTPTCAPRNGHGRGTGRTTRSYAHKSRIEYRRDLIIPFIAPLHLPFRHGAQDLQIPSTCPEALRLLPLYSPLLFQRLVRRRRVSRNYASLH